MPLPRALKVGTDIDLILESKPSLHCVRSQRNDAEWTRVLLNEMQLDFSFAVYKGACQNLGLSFAFEINQGIPDLKIVVHVSHNSVLGTFLTRWMSNRLLLVGQHSPFFDQVKVCVLAH